MTFHPIKFEDISSKGNSKTGEKITTTCTVPYYCHLARFSPKFWHVIVRSDVHSVLVTHESDKNEDYAKTILGCCRSSRYCIDNHWYSHLFTSPDTNVSQTASTYCHRNCGEFLYPSVQNSIGVVEMLCLSK
ncbi:hypothetical protein Q1695_007083 [Nippostrongylus brasiliensis]|nr:hypothetical protein Q1695_007083 [Nippostrongylus brasiliensis]